MIFCTFVKHKNSKLFSAKAPCPPPEHRHSKGFAPNNLLGFTLAETLITLTIIGIIAALTIPTLLEKGFERQAVARAKQTYAQFSNAYMLFEAENGCRGAAECFSAYPYRENEQSFEPIISKLRVAQKACTPISGGFLRDIDWLPSARTKTMLDGDFSSSITSVSNNSSYDSQSCFYLLENGVTVAVTSEGVWQDYIKYVSFDINGKKPPNQTGVDTFSFAIMEKISPEFYLHPWSTPFYAAGMCTQNRCPEGGQNIEERRPLVYVIKHSKLPDLKKVKEVLGE